MTPRKIGKMELFSSFAMGTALTIYDETSNQDVFGVITGIWHEIGHPGDTPGEYRVRIILTMPSGNMQNQDEIIATIRTLD